MFEFRFKEVECIFNYPVHMNVHCCVWVLLDWRLEASRV